MLELAQKLFKEGLISESSFEKLKLRYTNSLFSLNFELKTLLFSGVMLLTGGLGIIIYKNIDSIGHLAVIIFIAVISFFCYYYCYKKRIPYSNEKVQSPSIIYEYILLLGCLTFVSFNGYLQYQYSVYGSANGASFLLPAILLFATAYYFDHIGVLSLAITCFAAFVGITIAPQLLLSGNDFSSEHIIYTGLFFGVSLVLIAWYLSQRQIKKHFTFTYYNFGAHLLFVSCLAGMISLEQFLIFLPIMSLLVFLCMRHGFNEQSFYFLLLAVIYGYIGLSCFLIHLFRIESGIEIWMFYFVLSSVFIIRFLNIYRKKMKKHADL